MKKEFGAITTQFVEPRGYIDAVYERTNARIDVQFDALRAEMKIMRAQGQTVPQARPARFPVSATIVGWLGWVAQSGSPLSRSR